MMPGLSTILRSMLVQSGWILVSLRAGFHGLSRVLSLRSRLYTVQLRGICSGHGPKGTFGISETQAISILRMFPV